MNLREAALKALSALEYTAYGERPPAPEVRDALTALRTALAEAEEPVAWRVRALWTNGGYGPWRIYQQSAKPGVNHPECCDFEPLYTHPPRREPLTEEQIAAVRRELDFSGVIFMTTAQCKQVARVVERVHGIGWLPPVAEQPTCGGLGGDE